jgi:hypothetical protein
MLPVKSGEPLPMYRQVVLFCPEVKSIVFQNYWHDSGVTSNGMVHDSLQTKIYGYFIIIMIFYKNNE